MTEATGIVGEFLSLKEETDADVLAMQCGDFYEFFADDAELVAAELDLKVSQKSSHGSSYPMAGVPLKDLTPYLKALVERGYRVAVADQHEENGDIYREIERVVTPGTLLETTRDDAQYLAAVVRDGDEYGLAFADVTTGRFLVTNADTVEAALTELYRFSPAEVLPGPGLRDDEAFCDRVRDRTDARISLHDADAFAPGKATHTAREHFGTETFESLGVTDLAVRAGGAVLDYVAETGTGVLASMTRVQPYHGGDHAELDATTQRNLELTETMHGDRSGSLFDTIDHTVTSPGGRLLKEWIQRPRQDLSVLDERQAAVAALASGALGREELRDVLDDAYDLERLASKTVSGSADAGDLLRIEETLGVLPALVEAIQASPALDASPLADIVDRPDREAAAGLREELGEALAEDPPKTVTQGGLFKQGYDDELDQLIERHEAVQEYFDTLADRVKRQYGLSHVTVDRNKTDGYYVQVGKSVADQVPEHFEHVKTLKNSKRFSTDELAEKERELLRLEEQRGDLEYELFEELRERVAREAELLQDVGRTVARIDALQSLATHAVTNDWTQPELVEDRTLDISQGRHPVVEQTVQFVPNDCRMDDDSTFTIVTGPNMSGKSTFMRQNALIVLLAQVGSFVPAKEATVGLVDGIFTRVGALDELAQGRSTFMVEMQELSNILHSATADSLVILDEVGRGTATYDGISIAWAATEYLHNEVRAKTLFATHYHELTALADHLDRVVNVHIAADERDGDVTFLRTVREGPTDRSYGIHVADLAGVPGPVVDRARDVLDRLRQEKAIEAKGGSSGASGSQQVVFDLGSGSMTTADGGTAQDSAEDEPELDPETEAVLSELADLDIAQTSPIELMGRVEQWQQQLNRE
ncbi:DNA mismatch repair protein MutS [Haloarchaeobius sp. HME9146]|uniref:DNA mismatch repair protein MutS n=1 Tax=Haloarchaeobius sp. HME9146 TaxID=2978732 RepID=UPI0021BE6869|nr:DNA mismatch repair protein MutS [Haloarchaeobius sp. HME9146]MCT9095546.1 DNA mismatch repair protein MutS [Haloarchaeobius sp. HME9146]